MIHLVSALVFGWTRLLKGHLDLSRPFPQPSTEVVSLLQCSLLFLIVHLRQPHHQGISTFFDDQLQWCQSQVWSNEEGPHFVFHHFVHFLLLYLRLIVPCPFASFSYRVLVNWSRG